MGEHLAPVIHAGIFEFDLAAIFMILLTSVIVFVLAVLGTRNASVTNPGKLQNFMEWVIEFVQGLISTATDYKKGKVYLTLGLTLIMYIFVGNMLGLPLNISTSHTEASSFLGQEYVSQAKIDELAHKAEEKGEHFHGAHVNWYKSPTADAAVTMALALIVILLSHVHGLTRNGKHYLHHYIEPHPLFLPLTLIKEVAKPLTLGLRLYGNIYAGEVMIAVIMGLGWIGIPGLMLWQGFSIFVGAIQAFVFTMLTMVYLSQAAIHEEH